MARLAPDRSRIPLARVPDTVVDPAREAALVRNRWPMVEEVPAVARPVHSPCRRVVTDSTVWSDRRPVRSHIPWDRNSTVIMVQEFRAIRPEFSRSRCNNRTDTVTRVREARPVRSLSHTASRRVTVMGMGR